MTNTWKVDHAFDFVPIFNVPLSPLHRPSLNERFVEIPSSPSVTSEGPLLPPATGPRPNQLTRTKKCPRLSHQKRRLHNTASPPPSSFSVSRLLDKADQWNQYEEASDPIQIKEVESRVGPSTVNEGFGVTEQVTGREPFTDTAEAQMLKRIFRSPSLRSQFAVFLRSQFCEENLSFWVAAEEFRENCATNRWNVTEMSLKAIDIYKKHFFSGSVELVNVECSTSKEIKQAIDRNAVTVNMFDRAQDEIFHLLRYDCWSRFLKDGGVVRESDKSRQTKFDETISPEFPPADLKTKDKSIVTRLLSKESVSDSKPAQQKRSGLQRSLSKIGILSGAKKAQCSSDVYRKRLSLLSFRPSPTKSNRGGLDRTTSAASFRTFCLQHL